ncbi:Virulence-associated E [Trichormus variabilis ATCC 29413]|uniref:Virulence-associated E n=2 Tax=Anabaena variabilis TaxID=264691 RepID=Q3M8I3_TRIV2|nr:MULTISPECIES: VapE domain-containing protein [Nostocaceae]ABA22703.1 Virulence-associated E [Trichormus variabilis ATCC 29413]MBC1215059.1 virulence-associated E [Trichormus variabilis ARAD]MBC1254982.1 virulence-associated E [Trichormus variabilis V5]MBC1267962.1 virulence-associated E [Trichormus variabilis FSR]MBC1303730.1 virulence-associated E [Trichormus variabilis N2B]
MSTTFRVTQQFSSANNFLKLVGEPPYLFQTFDDSKHKDRSLTRQFYGSLDEHWDKLVEFNNRGAGIFVTVNMTSGNKRKAENITAVRALFIDCDNELPNEFHLTPTVVVNSSNNKGHAYWLLDKASNDVANFTQHQQQLIKHYGSDPAVKDLPRIMRLPGFNHMKGEPTLVTFIQTGKPYESMASITDGLVSNDFIQQLESFANKVKNAPEGTRNDTLNTAKYTLAGAYPNKLPEIDQRLTEVALENGLTIGEIKPTLNSGDVGAQRPIKLVGSGKRSKSNMVREVLEQFFGDELQWDEMKNKLRFRGQNVTAEKLHDICERELDIDLPFESFKRMASVKASDNPYHAVREYLQSLPTVDNPEPVLSALYQAMGITNKLHRLYIRRWLIAAVGRAMTPGCKADCALVLQGKQGIGKTTFFNSLFGEFFQTLGEHKSDVDQLLSMARSWCIEWGEIENAFSRKAVSAIKSFMSTTHDVYRRPYAAEPDNYPRHFIICGTTNQSEFLTDSTGNRRFWVVNAENRIDTAAVKEMRDDVWSAVLKLYLDGEPSFLNETEVVESAEDTSQYEQTHPWFAEVSAYMTHHNPCTLADIMKNALGFETSRLNDKKAQREVSDILDKLGCTKKQQRLNGVKAIYWHKPTLDNVTTDDVRVTTKDIPTSEYF